MDKLRGFFGSGPRSDSRGSKDQIDQGPKRYLISVVGNSSDTIEKKLNQIGALLDVTVHSGYQDKETTIRNPCKTEVLSIKHVKELDLIPPESIVALLVDLDTYDVNTSIKGDLEIYRTLLGSTKITSQKLILWMVMNEQMLARVSAVQLGWLFPQEQFGYGSTDNPVVRLEEYGSDLKTSVFGWFNDLFMAVHGSVKPPHDRQTYCLLSLSVHALDDVDFIWSVVRDIQKG